MRAALFPGQGIDARSLLGALGDGDPRVVQAADLLGYDPVGAIERMARQSRTVLPTELAQPAIYVASVAAHERAVAENERFDVFLGHSLGEYAALTAGGAISFAHGVRLVAARGEAMAEAAARRSGGMAAVLGLDIDVVERIADANGVVVANDNSPVQAVVSGDEAGLARVARAARAAGARCVRLDVEGAFHSDAMEPAAAALSEALVHTDVRSPRSPVISNRTARPYRAPGEIRKLLSEQLTHRVRFRESVEHAVACGVTDFVDLGPGRVVGRLARQTVGAEVRAGA